MDCERERFLFAVRALARYRRRYDGDRGWMTSFHIKKKYPPREANSSCCTESTRRWTEEGNNIIRCEYLGKLLNNLRISMVQSWSMAMRFRLTIMVTPFSVVGHATCRLLSSRDFTPLTKIHR
jgi:hypothetical protein